jgi:hypothetical protein
VLRQQGWSWDLGLVLLGCLKGWTREARQKGWNQAQRAVQGGCLGRRGWCLGRRGWCRALEG